MRFPANSRRRPRPEGPACSPTGDWSPASQLPVKVDRGDPQRVAIDWDAFLASPDRKAAVKEAVQGESANANKRMLDANPDLAQQLRANNAAAVLVWANAVKAGKMSREKFDKTVDLEVKVGRMDPADAEAARATLDAVSGLEPALRVELADRPEEVALAVEVDRDQVGEQAALLLAVVDPGEQRLAGVDLGRVRGLRRRRGVDPVVDQEQRRRRRARGWARSSRRGSPGSVSSSGCLNEYGVSWTSSS